MNLIDLITGSKISDKAENSFGVSKTQLLAIAAVAVPLIISYLKKKSQDSNEAESLNNALERDHDGSILNNPDQAVDREAEGGSILSHIFGDKKSNVESGISQTTGVSMDKIGPILGMLAPLIMGYIGKQKKDNNVAAGGLGDLLGGIMGGGSQGDNPLGGLLGSVLGGKASGGGLDDILGSVLGGGQAAGGGLGDLLGGNLGGDDKKSSNEGGLDDLLGGLFGKK